MADSGEVKHGYRIKRVASTVDKMAQAQQNDSDSLKGLPLIGQKNRLQGNPESDGSPYSDAYCLPTDRACALGTEAVTPGASAIARHGECIRRTDTSATGENTRRPVHRRPSRTQKQLGPSSPGS